MRSPATWSPGNRTAGSSSATGSAATFWGRGLATAALAEFVEELDTRPLHAWVATSNVGSIRVLEKCGFVKVGSQRTTDVEELLYELR